MRASLPREHRLRADHEAALRRDTGQARLWHIGAALAVSFTAAMLGLAGLAWLAWVLLGQAEAGSAHERTRVFNERFTAIATQLGDNQAAVRLAGVHSMAGLADDSTANRQTCVDVLCAYLRMRYEPDPGEDAPAGTDSSSASTGRYARQRSV